MLQCGNAPTFILREDVHSPLLWCQAAEPRCENLAAVLHCSLRCSGPRAYRWGMGGNEELGEGLGADGCLIVHCDGIEVSVLAAQDSERAHIFACLACACTCSASAVICPAPM